MPPRNRLLRRVKRHARFSRLARQPASGDSYRPVSPQPPSETPVVRARLLTQRDRRDYAQSVPVQDVVPAPAPRPAAPPAAAQREPRATQPYPTPPAAAPRDPGALPLRQPASPSAPEERQPPAVPPVSPQPAAAPPLQRAPQPPPAAPPAASATPSPAASQPPPAQPPADDAPSEEEQASWNRLQSIMRAHKTMEAEGREPEVKRNIEAPWLREAARKADQQAARRRRKTSRPAAQEPPRVQRTGRRTEVTYVKPGEESAPTQVPAPPPLRPRPVVDTPGEPASGETPPVQRTPSPERPPADAATRAHEAAPPQREAPADAETAPRVQRAETPPEAAAPAAPERRRTSAAAEDAPPPAETPPGSRPPAQTSPAVQRRPADTPAAAEPAGQASPSAAEQTAASRTPEPESVVEPPAPAEDETIVRRVEQPSAAPAEPAGPPDAAPEPEAGPSLDKVWPVQQQAPDASSRLEMVDDPAEIVPDRPPRPFRERETEEDAPVRDVLRKVDSGQKSRAKIETLMPRLPRPRNAPPPRAKAPAESKPRVQRSEPPEIEMIETEIGELPSDLWTLLGQPVPGKEKAAGETPSASSGEMETASSVGQQVTRTEKSKPAPRGEPAPDVPESRTPPAPEVPSAAGATEPPPPAEPEAPADAPAAAPAQQVARTPEEERDDGPKVKGAPPRTPPTAERAPTSGPRDWVAERPTVDVPPAAPAVQRAEEAAPAFPQEHSRRVSDAPVPGVARAADAPDFGAVVDVVPRTEGRLAPEFTPAAPEPRGVAQREAISASPPAAGPLAPLERVADVVAAPRPEPAVQRAPERRVEPVGHSPEAPAPEAGHATDEALQRAIARAEAPPEGARARREEKRAAEDGAAEKPARVDRPVIQRTIEIPDIETRVTPDRADTGEESGPDEAEIDVDKLAREVYREIKRRLDVERERGRGLFG